MMSLRELITKPSTPFQGQSKSAQKRRDNHARFSGVLHNGVSGQIIEMSNRKYVVDRDGSFRRLDKKIA